MAEEVKPKATAAKTKVAEKTPEVINTPVQVEEVVKPVAPVVAKAKEEPKVAEEAPEVKAPVVVEVAVEVAVAEVVDASDDDVEIMSRRSRKAKSEKIAEFAHELSVKMHNEPHLESLYRAEYAEKVAKLK
jgi:hypothetical protein